MACYASKMVAEKFLKGSHFEAFFYEMKKPNDGYGRGSQPTVASFIGFHPLHYGVKNLPWKI